MPAFDFTLQTRVSDSVRARQLEGIFDVPYRETQDLRLSGDLPIDDAPWNVGLIVGPSGSGKTRIAHNVFGAACEPPLTWGAASVIDDFAASATVEAISHVCSAVGFNTITAWLRPYAVLSNGEQFRAQLARRLLEQGDPIVVDEFSSVVDRQVAQIASHAVQKHVRAHDRKFVAVACHYDIVDWLQPDWVFEPASGTFTRRLLRRRPALDVEVRRVPYDAWRVFAPFHYLTAELNRNARCFALFVADRIAAFAGMLHRPHPKVRDIYGLSRLVTLPDFQGLGLAFVLCDALAAAYKSLGYRYHTYPAHPALIRAFDRSPNYALKKVPGMYIENRSKTGTVSPSLSRPCAVFQYVGASMSDAKAARALLDG